MVSAKFVADFSSFTQALDRAQLELRNFDKEIGKVDSTLAKFGDSFSGRKVMTDAALATKAVMDLGGAATLTAKEQAKLNPVLAEAIEKYAVLGKTAPKAMVDLERATRDAATATQGASGWWSDLGKTILGTAAGFVSAQAILAAIGKAVGFLKDEIVQLTIGGAQVADVAEGFERLTSEAGVLGSTLLGTLRAGTHSTITDLDLMKSVNQGMAAGFVLTADKAKILADGAFALAQVTGTDVKTAFDKLNEAMQTGQDKGIKLLVQRVDLEAAEIKYAAALGISSTQLTEAQELEAKRIAILEAVSAGVERLGVQTDGLDEKVQQAQVAWANFQNDLGKSINQSPVLVAAIDEIGKILTKTFGGDTEKLVKMITRAVDELLISMVEFGRIAVSVAGFVVKEWFAAQKVFGNVAQVIDGVVLATLYLEKAQLSLGHILGTNTEQWKQNDKAIGDTMQRMLDRGAALQEQTRAQQRVDEVTKAFDKTLLQLKTRMEEARVTTTNMTDVVQQFATATVKADAATAGLIKQSIHAALTTERWMTATRGLGKDMDSMGVSAEYAANEVARLAAEFEAAEKAAEDFGKTSVAAIEKTSKATTAAATVAAGGSFNNPYALSTSMSAAQQAARANELGGTIAYDSYNNPYVYVPGVNLPGSGTSAKYRAGGGPVSRNKPYVVGEQGPELFVPSQSGSIANGWGGGVSLTVNVDARESFYESASGVQRLADKISMALVAQMRARGMAVGA